MSRQKRCRYCGAFLATGETAQSHHESCGAITDGFAERISPRQMLVDADKFGGIEGIPNEEEGE